MRTGILLGITASSPEEWLCRRVYNLADVPRSVSGLPQVSMPFRLRRGTKLGMLLDEGSAEFGSFRRSPSVSLFVDGSEVGCDAGPEITWRLLEPRMPEQRFWLLVDLQFDTCSVSMLDAGDCQWRRSAVVN